MHALPDLLRIDLESHVSEVKVSTYLLVHLSFLFHQVHCLGIQSYIWKSCHLITHGHPAGPETLLNRRWDHHILDQGRTQQNLGGGWWEVPLHHLPAESQNSQLLSTLSYQSAMNT